MKQIGEFAKDNKVTVKTLHYYEKLELLLPKEVDDATGYRYYSNEQSDDLKLILFLKELGLSLSEIKDVMMNQYDRDTFIEFLLFKYRQVDNDLINTSKRLFRLKKVIGVLKDTSLNQVKLKELIGMSEKELDTGVYGRSEFIEEAETRFNKAVKEKLPFSVVEIDLDRFKRVNDDFGYDVGDVVIKRTQDEIISTLQSSDAKSILERRGGDEFTIVLNLNPRQASKLVTTILNNIVSIDYSDVAEDLKVGATAGIAGITKSAKIYQDVLHDATIALYQNKRNNR